MQSCHWTKFALRKVIKQSGSIGGGGGGVFQTHPVEPWDVQIIEIKWHSGNYYNHSKLKKIRSSPTKPYTKPYIISWWEYFEI